MNYAKKRKTLNSLNDLLLSIEAKQLAREVAIEFNSKNPLHLEPYDLEGLALEIQEMELEFKRKSREL